MAPVASSQAQEKHAGVMLCSQRDRDRDFPFTLHVKAHALDPVIAVTEILSHLRLGGQTVVVLWHATRNSDFGAGYGLSIGSCHVQHPGMNVVDADGLEFTAIADLVDALGRDTERIITRPGIHDREQQQASE